TAFLLLLVLVGALVATVLMVVPVARVALTPRLIAAEVTVPLVADVNQATVDLSSGMVPGRLVTDLLEASGEVPTAGRRDAPDLPASGTVVFVNLTPEEVEVPMGTVVRTSTGTTIRFSTTQTVTVPGPTGGRIEASVQALTSGPAGNVRRNLINRIDGSLGLRLTVTNPEPMSGGTVRQVGLVTYADKDRLRTSVLQKLELESVTRLQSSLAAGEYLLPQSVSIAVLDEVYEPPLVEVEAEKLRVTVRVRARAMAVPEENGNEVALRLLESSVEGRGQLAPQRVSFQRSEQVEMSADGQQAAFSVTARGVAVPEINLAVVRETIAGMPIDDAVAWMQENLPLQEPPSVTVTPDWLGRVPWLSFRVHLFVQMGES
ncbi:MAG: hypothetical protein GX605_01755, partial [Chloroflexi bacterium]|nr:hypothetical protein [Chloroflexota bacterium]